MKGTCKICGCTDEQACMTDAGPCSWVLTDLCSACVIVLEDTHNIKKFVPRACRYCGELMLYTAIQTGRVKGESYACSRRRFDVPGLGERRLFSWSGICRPNKTVAAAQKRCPYFIIRLTRKEDK